MLLNSEKVLTKNGYEELAEGLKILSLDQSTNSFVEDVVENINVDKTNPTTSYYVLYLDKPVENVSDKKTSKKSKKNDEIVVEYSLQRHIVLSPQHKILTTNGWKSVDRLVEEDFVAVYDNKIEPSYTMKKIDKIDFVNNENVAGFVFAEVKTKEHFNLVVNDLIVRHG